MSTLLQRIAFKFIRLLGSRRLMKIRNGDLKGVKWNVSIPDNRYLLGSYEPVLAEIIKSEVEEGKRLVDIGANAGYFSLLASKYGNNSNHLAIEPFPENVSLLREHLVANECDNVDVFQLAISDTKGWIQFSDSGNLAANTYKKESTTFTENSIKVETNELTSFAQENSLDEKCFLKIDVEGAELDVLKGGADYLQLHHPKMLLATHDCHVPGVKEDCLAYLDEIGYKYEVVEDQKIDGQEDFLCTSVNEI